MKNKKNIVLFLALLALLVFIGGSAYTFAKYFTAADNQIDTSIKRWDIVVNNETIRNKTTLTNKIVANFPNTNGHTKTNKIAPGVQGTLNIVIDYTNVDVSFKYDLSIAKNETIPDVKLSNVSVTGGSAENLNITTDANGVTHVTANVRYNASAPTKTQTITATIEWNDDNTNTMNDAADTAVGIDADSVDFDVQMDFVQIQE